MSDMEPGYTLAELCDLADVSQRTVRYYIAEGLLRSPGQGPAARYDEGHLLRLRLIRRLQRSHLPLAEIRNRLRGLGDEEVRSALSVPAAGTTAGTAAGTASGTAVDYVRSVLAGRGVVPGGTALIPPGTMRAPAAAPLAARHRRTEAAPPYAAPSAHEGPAVTPPASLSAPAELAGEVAHLEPERSQWERIALSPDVELHVRRPLSRHGNRQLARLVEAAREILQEGDS